jgi:hypothetical protein
LLEKCSDKDEQENNQTVFLYMDLSEGEAFEVNEVLEVLKKPKINEDKYLIRSVGQGDITDADSVLDKLGKKTTNLVEFFEPSYGNATYLYLASRGKISGPRNPGAKDFFYLDKSKLEDYGLKDYAYPALTSARYARWFTFTKDDWGKLKKKGSPCYFFMCHKLIEQLPKNVTDYIKWGESECRTAIRETRGGGKICSMALSCKSRQVVCKHIYAVYFSLGLRQNVFAKTQPIVETLKSDGCKNCGSSNAVKIGVRHNLHGNAQRFLCKDCGLDTKSEEKPRSYQRRKIK